MTIQSLPNTSFSITEFPVPGIQLPPSIYPSPYHDQPIPGDKLVYSPMSVTFLVNENLSNWKEIYDWMIALAAPEDKKAQYDISRMFADIDIIIYSNDQIPITSFHFIECVPTSLGNIDMTVEDSETVYKKCFFEAEYARYDVKIL